MSVKNMELNLLLFDRDTIDDTILTKQLVYRIFVIIP